jgi:hypothetical protein
MAFLNTKNPSLPIAPVVYDRHYQDALNNILRQYFITLDTLNANQTELVASQQSLMWMGNSGGFFSG